MRKVLFFLTCIAFVSPAAAQQPQGQTPAQGVAAQLGTAFGTCLAREAEEIAALQKRISELQAQLTEATKAPKAPAPTPPVPPADQAVPSK